MSGPAVDVGCEVAALHFYLATALRRDDEAGRMLSSIKQHRDAIIGSMADDAWVYTLNLRANESAATCRHCGRRIVNEGGRWVDPEATGDDSVWRETCEAHDTFTAEHEPQRV